MVQDHQLGRLKRGEGVSPARVIGELDFERIRCEHLDDGAYLPAHESARGDVLGQRDDVQQVDAFVHSRVLRN